MKKVNISKIKAELSKYLRFVRAGEEVVIMDREQAVAKMVPILAHDQLRIIDQVSDLKSIVAKWKGQSFSQNIDVVDILVSDREERF